jgi:hypothetical protein
MKGGKKRDIPLSDAAMALLASIPCRNDFTFPEGKWIVGKFIRFSGAMHHDGTMSMLRDMPFESDIRGMRATFESWATEHQLGHDATELALDHKIGGVVEE